MTPPCKVFLAQTRPPTPPRALAYFIHGQRFFYACDLVLMHPTSHNFPQ